MPDTLPIGRYYQIYVIYEMWRGWQMRRLAPEKGD